MENSIKQIRESQYGRFGSYLNQQHFFGTIFLAFILHAGGVALYQILPREAIEMIPVRVLNIKIGKIPTASDAPAEENIIKRSSKVSSFDRKESSSPKPAPQPKAIPAKVVAPKAAVPKPIIKSEVVAAKPAPASSQPLKTISEVARDASLAKQYIREDTVGDAPKTGEIKGGMPAGYGSPLGNSTAASAEIEKRYTQTLSLWINKFKIYPVEARKAGLGGTVMLRLRINRQGRIMQYYLEKPSGHQVIDQAISSMVNAANPVPAIPQNYPDARPYLEFLIPIHFKP